MPESGPFGSVRGVPGNGHPYRDRRGTIYFRKHVLEYQVEGLRVPSVSV